MSKPTMRRPTTYRALLAERKKKLKEAERIEQSLGWAPGTLSNPDGWPSLPPKPRTPKQEAAYEVEEALRRAVSQAAWEECEDERVYEIAKALEEVLKDEPSVALGWRIEDLLKQSALHIYQDYSDWD